MDLLFSYQQEKKEKNNNLNICNFNLKQIGELLEFEGYYDFEYTRMDEPKSISYVHKFSINLKNGDIITTYQIKNSNIGSDTLLFKNCDVQKKNKFKLLYDLTENAILRGEKRSGFWGAKYNQSVSKLFQVISDILKQNISTVYITNKLKSSHLTRTNDLFDLIVDFHLDKKRIKSHDDVYFHIQYEYPKPKWLKKNDNKFLPAILDSYGIKSKYLISELNKIKSYKVHIASLNYFCKLFGDNYIDYLKKIEWESHCFVEPPNKRTHVLKTESEKNCMVKTIKNWERENVRLDSLVYSVNKLLTVRDELEKKGLDLKYSGKSDNEFEIINSMWVGHRQYFNRGYKIKYDFIEDFIKDIEETIEVDNTIYKPRILMSEDDFRTEGFDMKNCMGNQFIHGVFSIFISLENEKKKVNLQYRKGYVIQSYGKANTPVPIEFQKAIDIITEKFKKYNQMTWSKIKYNIITN
jgi:hypothetical protein